MGISRITADTIPIVEARVTYEPIECIDPAWAIHDFEQNLQGVVLPIGDTRGSLGGYYICWGDQRQEHQQDSSHHYAGRAKFLIDGKRTHFFPHLSLS